MRSQADEKAPMKEPPDGKGVASRVKNLDHVLFLHDKSRRLDGNR